MNAPLTLVSDQEAVLGYLDQARKHHTQAAIAKYLDIGVRTVRRWEARQTAHPPIWLTPCSSYCHSVRAAPQALSIS